MEMLERYLNTKKESYHWLLSELQRITQHLRARIDEMLANEHRTIKEGCQYASNQEISMKIGEMSKNHHLHLQKVVDMVISAMASLAYSLNNQASVSRHSVYTVPEPQAVKSVVSQLQNVSPILHKALIPQPTQLSPPKIQIKIPKKIITVPSHSLIANHKPQRIIELSKQHSPNTLTSIQAKTEPRPQSPSPFVNKFQAQRVSRRTQQQKEEILVFKEACVKDCLQLDHKIYNEANEYLNNVIRTKQRGMSPLRKSFLTKSPITQLEASRKA